MSVLFTWVVAASSLLAPARQHDELASAIADRVEVEPPLFKGDDDRHRTAALLVAIAFRESSLRAAAVGDHVGGKPTSFCAFQVHLPWGAKTADGWTGQDLLEDPDKCVAAAMRMLRMSMQMCPSHPLAWYAAGPTGCGSPRAQRISRDRMAIAQRLLRDVQKLDDAPHSSLLLGPRGGALDPALPRPRQYCGGA
ncbi:MAG: hypothetical protein NVS3B10_09190 [Polyangiales bacterium]